MNNTTPAQIQEAQNRATAAWNKARESVPHFTRPVIDATWEVFKWRSIRADRDGAAPSEKLAIANYAAAVMDAIYRLQPQQKEALAASDLTRAAAKDQRDAAEAAWNSTPALASFRAEQIEDHAKRHAAHVAAIEAQRAQAERNAPRDVLAGLRARGFGVALSPDGKSITLPPGQSAKLMPGELDNVKRLKAGIVAALKAEAAAAAPVVIA